MTARKTPAQLREMLATLGEGALSVDRFDEHSVGCNVAQAGGTAIARELTHEDAALIVAMHAHFGPLLDLWEAEIAREAAAQVALSYEPADMDAFILTGRRVNEALRALGGDGE